MNQLYVGLTCIHDHHVLYSCFSHKITYFGFSMITEAMYQILLIWLSGWSEMSVQSNADTGHMTSVHNLVCIF